MQSITQLEANLTVRPNSIEINQALAEAYEKEERWQEAVKVYRGLVSLYPDTAALFINRIKLGAAALIISSVLVFSAEVLRPSLLAYNPPEDLAGTISSFEFLIAQILFMLAFALYSCSAISIYKLLSYTRHHQLAFWGMVLSVIGVGLSMPSLGIDAIVLPLVGKLFLQGQTQVLSLYSALQQDSLQFILRLGGYLLIAGILIFTWVIWHSRNLSVVSILIYLAGWILFVITNNQHLKPVLILIGVLILVGGIGLGHSLWIQATRQFDPTMDRSMKS
jgi:hypothetical protein